MTGFNEFRRLESSLKSQHFSNTYASLMKIAKIKKN